MTIQTVEAVYEHGIFRLIQPTSVTLAEGQHVRLVVEMTPSNQDVLALAMSVFDGLSEQEIADIETIAHHRLPFFGERA